MYMYIYIYIYISIYICHAIVFSCSARLLLVTATFWRFGVVQWDNVFRGCNPSCLAWTRRIWKGLVNVCKKVPYLVAHPTNRKWVITPVINGISSLNPLITGVITHLLSGMSHQVELSLIQFVDPWKGTIYVAATYRFFLIGLLQQHFCWETIFKRGVLRFLW